MAYPRGNEYWQLRKKHGKPKKIKTPQRLWELACDYFQMTDDNPLKEEKGFAFQGTVTRESFAKMRAYTWDGFEDYLCEKEVIANIDDYKANKDNRYSDYANIIRAIGRIIRNQKFQGAAANLLDPNIIARDLGLVDKQNHEHSEINITVKREKKPPIDER